MHWFVDINMYEIGVSPVTERQSLRSYGVELNVCKPVSSQRMLCFANRAYKVWNLLPANAVLLCFSLFKKYVHNFILNKHNMGH